MIECKKCGGPISEDSAFCEHCGKKHLPQRARPVKKGNGPLIVIIILLLVIIALLAILIPKLLPVGDSPAVEPTPSVEPSPEVSLEPSPTVSVEPTPNSYTLSTAAESVVYLEVYDIDGEPLGCASGFLVETNIKIATNYHVVQDAYFIKVWSVDEEETANALTLLNYDEVADLAILKIDNNRLGKPLVLGNSDEVKQGDPVYAIGYPLGVAHTMSNGIIGAKYQSDFGIDVLQVTAAVSPGSSGGPLVDADGYVVGVISAYYTRGQNLNMAVASNVLQELLDETERPISLAIWRDRPLSPWQEEMDPEPTPTPAPDPAE